MKQEKGKGLWDETNKAWFCSEKCKKEYENQISQLPKVKSCYH
jgi:uncharacterized pyridoxamine 5'-phosphate oxidase family protein